MPTVFICAHLRQLTAAACPVFAWQCRSCHARAHTHRETRKHKHTHTNTHTNTHQHTHKHTHTHTHTQTHKCTYINTHTHTHTHRWRTCGVYRRSDCAVFRQCSSDNLPSTGTRVLRRTHLSSSSKHVSSSSHATHSHTLFLSAINTRTHAHARTHARTHTHTRADQRRKFGSWSKSCRGIWKNTQTRAPRR